jgi:hypothetical protein
MKQLSLWDYLNETKSIEPEQPEGYRYAVNLADMLGAGFPVKMLIQPVISPNSERVLAEGSDKMDGTAVVLECDSERGEAIHFTLRLKIPKHQLRMYRQKAGTSTWQKI